MSAVETNSQTKIKGAKIRIRGMVQGVGFRPTIWQLANKMKLVGWVKNDGEGVLIHCWGSDQQIAQFLEEIPQIKPPLSSISSIKCSENPDQNTYINFAIVQSEQGEIKTSIVPDAATCQDCLRDISDKNNRRYRYPFTNCTNCGPRLSITHTIPYDRANTSMASFIMCDACQDEYEAPSSRRFHAQPNACPNCGPELWLCDKSGERLPLEQEGDVIQQAAALLKEGKILAIKGIGGFHLVCVANNNDAVESLRQRKKRYGKPLALMARSINVIKQYAEVNQCEAALLVGSSAPIVLLPKKSKAPEISKYIAPGQSNLGFLLPYTPMHHLLLKEFDVPLVMTSGNISNEPQVIDNKEALKKLDQIVDYWLMNDRDIINRLDDSITILMNKDPTIFRRARGYAPIPLKLPIGFEKSPPILAMGAQLKNTFCLLKNGEAILSQHIGDLEDLSAHQDYRTALKLYKSAFDFTTEYIVVDGHPEYFSSQWGQKIALERDIGLIRVQHHHAHITAVMAEHQLPLKTEPVLGIVLDGLGLGESKAGEFNELWGGEFLIANYKSYNRVENFKPVAIPGGAKASFEPWRNGFAHLHASLGWRHVTQNYDDLSFVKMMNKKPLKEIAAMIDNNLNAPLISSAGRLFDAGASMLGICNEGVEFEGQAAMQLQSLAEQHNKISQKPCEPYQMTEGSPISWDNMWRGILSDLKNNIPTPEISARFHQTLIEVIAQTASRLANENNLKIVVLSGGVFQNKLLNEGVFDDLTSKGLTVLTPRDYPANDGGIALGQVVIAAARLQ